MTQTVEYYLGQLIEHPSERAALEVIADELARLRCDAVVLANFSIRSTQIDFVVVTPNRVLLIEAKHSRWPIDGAENGSWRFKLPNGLNREFPNPYQQTLSAKNSLRDEMRSFAGSDPRYPDALLCYLSIAPHSTLFRGDHKVEVTDLGGLRSALGQSGRTTWTLDDWRRFALSMRLTKYANASALTSRAIAEARATLDQYRQGFAEYYGPQAQRWLTEADPEIALPIGQIPAPEGTFLLGPSGCGKSLAAYGVAMRHLEEGGLPIVIAGKDFDGKWQETLTGEVALLCDTPIGAFLKAARLTEAPMMFVLDGLNELAADHSSRAARGLAALIRRYQADLLITSTKLDEAFENLHREQVASPSIELKRRIAQRSATGPMTPAGLELVDALTTGMECALAGAVISELPLDAGRYAIFDSYVRSRLGTNASNGIALVVQFASSLSAIPTFSMTEREWDRSIGPTNPNTFTASELVRCGILERRRDRISFRHELYLQAFGAEAVVRMARTADELAAALKEPRHSERTAMIISAIDDPAIVAALLDRTDNAYLLLECFRGTCGPVARDKVCTILDALLARVSQEIASLRFAIEEEDGPPRVVLVSDSIAPWTNADRAGLAALGLLVETGFVIDKVLRLCAQMDERLESERQRLRPRLAQLRIGFRNAAFGYVFATPWCGRTGLCTIVEATRSFWQAGRAITELDISARLSNPGISAAQAYLLLKLARGHFGDQDIAAPVANVIAQQWPTSPYHLRLDLLDAAHHAQTDEGRSLLIAAVYPLLDQDLGIGLNTSVVEALRALGALDEDGEAARESIRTEIVRVLREGPTNAEAATTAWSLYVNQFDHPFDWVHAEEVSALDDLSRREFVLLAATGAPEDSFFLEFVVGEVALLEDVRAIPLFRKWGRPPNRESHVPQDAMRVFVLAHRALGRFGTPPEPDAYGGQVDAAVAIVRLVGSLLRAIDDRNLDAEAGRGVVDKVWQQLSQYRIAASVGVIADAEEALTHWDDRPNKHFGIISIAESSAPHALNLSRNLLDAGDPPIGYFAHSSGSKGFAFAFRTISRLGDSSDIPRLRRLVTSSEHGESALRALRVLEEKL